MHIADMSSTGGDMRNPKDQWRTDNGSDPPSLLYADVQRVNWYPPHMEFVSTCIISSQRQIF